MSLTYLSKRTIPLAICAGLFGFSTHVPAQDISTLPYVTQLDGQADPNAIPTREAMWGMFVLVSSSENRSPGMGLQLLRAIGLSEADAANLLRHVRTSIEDAKRYARSLSADQCARSVELRSSAVALGQALNSAEAKMDRQRDSYVAGVQKAVTPDGFATVTKWTNEKVRPALKLTVIDHEARLRITQADPQEEVSHLCSTLDQPSFQAH